MNKKLFSGWALDLYESRVGPLFPNWLVSGCPWVTGRLGHSLEGGVKDASLPLVTMLINAYFDPFMTG